MPTILGVDPGARETGLVVVDGDQVLAHDVVVADGKLDPQNPVDLAYLDRIRRHAETLLAVAGVGHALDAIAIEKIGAPNPHLGTTNAAGAIACAAVIGELHAWAAHFGDVVPVMLIDTAGHGRELLQTYPSVLVGPNEPKGTGILRHARSAYDVALAARWYLKLAQQGAKV